MSKSRRVRGTRSVPASRRDGHSPWVFRLYIAGWGPRYQTAHENLKHLCEVHLGTEYEIEMVDLQRHPERASEDNVIAIPTVIKVSPEPAIRIIGDLSDAGKVMAALGRTPRVR